MGCLYNEYNLNYIQSKRERLMKIAFLGGTFDPPHLGHTRLARQVLAHKLTDLVLFVPSWHPPHKNGMPVTPFFNRMAMLKLAVEGVAGFAVSDIEERLKKTPSYTIDIIRELEREYPDDRIELMIGADSLIQLHTWYRGDLLAAEREFITYPRPGIEVNLDVMKQYWAEDIALKLTGSICDLPVSDISSSEIRARLGRGEKAAHMMEKTVCQYILDHKLYRE